MNGWKALGASLLGLTVGTAAGFVLSEAVTVSLLLLGGGDLPPWAPGIRYLIVVGAAAGLVGGPLPVARRGRQDV
ncbi:DUF5957 family protein [Nocardiopsis sp. CC223A]|uniref:DUF5957 family protein n=1 Tax=Nocardiopsis sp. CC223A TaxID=3044051 RepID=UPI0027961073|nr:DUF5957 family protein [Nocardiopsis sp. CC223A]